MNRRHKIIEHGRNILATLEQRPHGTTDPEVWRATQIMCNVTTMIAVTVEATATAAAVERGASKGRRRAGRRHARRRGDAAKSKEGTSATEAASANDLEGKEAPAARSANGASRILRFARRVLLVALDAGLLLAFCLLAASWSFRRVFRSHLTPQIENMRFEEDERATSEATYLRPRCEREDVTTSDPEDLFLEKSCADAEDDPDAYAKCAADHQRKHGASLFPAVLSPSAASELRDYVLERNSKLTDADAIGVIKNERRWSFGLSPTDHPSVDRALREISTHPLLVPALEAVAGSDPAVIELSTITSAYGAKDQRWHEDIDSQFGNLVYARSFVPTYSLFIQLQDTYAEMGATSVCPGTHVCYGGATESVCPALDLRLGGHNDSVGDQVLKRPGSGGRVPSGPWKAGRAALMNQGLYHRGTAHVDPDGPERAMLVLTFAPRPQHPGERRQIGFGGSYSIRWDVWGHTLYDFRDGTRAMAWPWAPLRALGAYKRPGAEWGWDYVSVASSLIANGYADWEQEDLERMLGDEAERKGTLLEWIPKEMVEGASGESWEEFLSNVVDAVYQRSLGCYQRALSVYGAVLVVLALLSRRRRKGDSGAAISLPSWKANAALHLLAVLAAARLMRRVDEGPWASDIAFESERESFVAGPFVDLPFVDLNKPTKARKRSRPSKPTREDVLLGRGYDGRDLNALDGLLDRRPGNVRFRELVSATSAWNRNGSSLDDVGARAVEDQLRREGRRIFVQSAPGEEWIEAGEGTTAQEEELRRIMSEEVLIARGGSAGFVVGEARAMISDARFGDVRLRATSINSLTVDRLQALSRIVLDRAVRNPSDRPSWAATAALRKGSLTRPSPHSLLRRRPSTFRKIQDVSDNGGDTEVFSVGDVVEAKYRGNLNEWYKARVTDVNRGLVDENGRRAVTYDVKYLHGDADDDLPPSAVREYVAPRLGEFLECRVDAEEDGVDETSWVPCFVIRAEGDGERYVARLEKEKTTSDFLPSRLRRRMRHYRQATDVMVEREGDSHPTRGKIMKRRGGGMYEVFYPEEDDFGTVDGLSTRMYRISAKVLDGEDLDGDSSDD